jgi:hypothetical protein
MIHSVSKTAASADRRYSRVPRRDVPTRLSGVRLRLLLVCVPGMVGIVLGLQRPEPLMAQPASAIRTDYPSGAVPAEIWRLTAKPTREIGGADDTTDFRDVHGVRFLGDGRIAVANAATNEIRVYDASNRVISRIGRKGAGPGEFNVLWELFAKQGTLIGTDNDHSAEVMSESGTLLRSLPRPMVPNATAARRVGVLNDGRLVVVARRVLEVDSSSDSVSVYVVAIESADGKRISNVWVVPRSPMERTKDGIRPLRGIRFAPFGNVSAGGDRICATYSSNWLVRCVDAGGKLVLEVRRQVRSTPVSGVAREFAALSYRAANPRAPKSELDAEIAQFRFADVAPVLGNLEVAENGDVWVSDFYERIGRGGPGSLVAPARPVPWHVFDRRGRWLSTVTLPPMFVPYHFSRTAIAGVSFDEDDVERVTVWGIERSAGRR